MTMPHLMNCAHSETGWCMDCVKEIWDKKDRLDESMTRLVITVKDRIEYMSNLKQPNALTYLRGCIDGNVETLADIGLALERAACPSLGGGGLGLDENATPKEATDNTVLHDTTKIPTSQPTESK